MSFKSFYCPITPESLDRLCYNFQDIFLRMISLFLWYCSQIRFGLCIQMDSKSIKQNETILLCISLIYFFRDSTEINSVKLKIIFVLCINLIYLYRDSSEITSVYTMFNLYRDSIEINSVNHRIWSMHLFNLPIQIDTDIFSINQI